MAEEDENVVAPGAAAAAPHAAAPRTRPRSSFPSFKGDMDSLATMDWVSKVDSYKTIARITTEEAAEAVKFAMEAGSVAEVWLRNLRMRDAATAADWAQLKPVLLARFSPKITASEKAQVVECLRQGKQEDVAAFYDRCISVQLLVDRDVPAAHKAGGGASRLREVVRGQHPGQVPPRAPRDRRVQGRRQQRPGLRLHGGVPGRGPEDRGQRQEDQDGHRGRGGHQRRRRRRHGRRRSRAAAWLSRRSAESSRVPWRCSRMPRTCSPTRRRSA